MTADNENLDIPVALIDQKRRLSLVWLIPLIAALIGGWLMFKTLNEKGPVISITFNHAEGVEIGKTRVRYKDVDVGKVKGIELSKNLEHVMVSVEMDKSMSDHLNKNTKFWIVRPRVSASGISGLTTLVSGIYIAMDPGKDDEKQRDFVGLEEPPRVTSSAEGKRYALLSDSLGSLDVGAPVYYRQVQVGEITDFHLAEDGSKVAIGFFVNSPYDRFVRENTRFWNVSGLNFDLTANGLSADLESLTSLLMGGVAFETPPNLSPGGVSPAGSAFSLYANHDSIDEEPHTHKQLYVMNFHGSLRGLSANAPVEFRGIQVGKVLDIDLRMNRDTLKVTMPVLVELYPDQVKVTPPISEKEESDKQVDKVLSQLVERGLRAQLASGNLITGQLFIDLDFVENASAGGIQWSKPFPEFPTAPTRFEEITNTAGSLLAKIDEMPLVEISENLKNTLSALGSLSKTMDKRFDPMAQQLQSTLSQLDKTLGSVNGTLAEDSPLMFQIRQLMDELEAAANSFESLTDYLQRHPDALIRGKAESPQ